MRPSCATRICPCPCQSSHLEPFCLHTYVQKYTYHVIDTFVYEPMLCELTYVRALSNVHTLNLFVYMKILANVHISYDRYFVYELKFCEFTYVSAVASPHFEAASYTSTHLQIYICHSIDTRVRIWAHAVQTHICFCPCECSHLEPLCIHQFYSKCTYFLS